MAPPVVHYPGPSPETGQLYDWDLYLCGETRSHLARELAAKAHPVTKGGPDYTWDPKAVTCEGCAAMLVEASVTEDRRRG